MPSRHSRHPLQRSRGSPSWACSEPLSSRDNPQVCNHQPSTSAHFLNMPTTIISTRAPQQKPVSPCSSPHALPAHLPRDTLYLLTHLLCSEAKHLQPPSRRTTQEVPSFRRLSSHHAVQWEYSCSTNRPLTSLPSVLYQ